MDKEICMLMKTEEDDDDGHVVEAEELEAGSSAGKGQEGRLWMQAAWSLGGHGLEWCARVL